MENIKFPNDQEFLANLILQRSGSFTKNGGREALQTWFRTGEKAQLAAFLTDNKILNRFLRETVQECLDEADELVANLPRSCFNRVISIGPGNGLLELCLFKKTGANALLLIDIEETDLHQAGFAAQGSGYASLDATKVFLTMNGVPEEAVKTCNPKSEPLPRFSFDLLMSILSMGFHYPCDDYLDFILENRNCDARVVVDRRDETVDAGFEALREIMRVEKRISLFKRERVFLANSEDA
jgi:hypothetical protein